MRPFISHHTKIISHHPQSGITGQMRMANNGSSAIVGKCSILIETDTGCTLVLDGVRHFLDIRLDLLSVGKLDDVKHLG